MVSAAWIGNVLELRPWKLVKRPSFRTKFSCGSVLPVQRSFALSAIEAREMSARQRSPNDAIQVEIESARSISDVRRHVHFGECSLGWIRSRHQPDDVSGL